MLDIQPGFTVARLKEIYAAGAIPPESLTMYVAGLRKAGLPEE